MRFPEPVRQLPWRRLLAELGVIVAGVLIALAVDSWWEGRQEQKRARQYVQQLLVDFRETQRALEGTIDGDASTLARVTAVLDRAQSGSMPPLDSLDLPSGYNYFEPLTGTLTALVEGGDLRLIDNDSVRFELIGYAALIESTQAVLRHTETLIWNGTEQLSLGRARHSRPAARGAATAAPRDFEVDVAGVLHDPAIISALQMQAAASQVRLFNLRRLIDPTARVIRRLEAEVGARR